MRNPIHAYAAYQPKSQLQSFDYTPGDLKADEIEVAISHCGICHSDVHLVDNDWDVSIYPLVPGHEIIGTISALGSEIKQFSIGQRVGIGWQCNSCMDCNNCKHGEENLCQTPLATANDHYGGFASHVRANARFVFSIPEKLASENAAPLLCGGITVYTPLRNYNIRPYHKVGIIGIGGLGHLALQFANAFGCEVTAFSSDKSKTQEAKTFGAHHFVSSTDESELDKIINSFDFILSTTTVPLNWGKYMSLLKAHGKLCFVGAVKNLTIPVFSLILGNKTVCGSSIGSPLEIQEMLEFASRHNIQAKTQLMPMSQASRALDLVRHNKARYRMVLEN